MKPRVQIATTTLPDGSELSLHEHDGRHYLQCDGAMVAGPVTRASELEMARIACSPFRPVRQPRLWIAGVALGETLAAVAAELPQKRAVFTVAEPSAELVGWHRDHLGGGVLEDDARFELTDDPTDFGGKAQHYHALLVHSDTAPRLRRDRALFDDRRWLGSAYEVLQPGGLLAIASTRRLGPVDKLLGRAGFQVTRHEIDVAAEGRKPRLHFLWLGRKKGQ